MPNHLILIPEGTNDLQTPANYARPQTKRKRNVTQGIDSYQQELSESYSHMPPREAAKNKEGSKERWSREDPWGGKQLDKLVRTEQKRLASQGSANANLMKMAKNDRQAARPVLQKFNAVGTTKVSIGAQITRPYDFYAGRRLKEKIEAGEMEEPRPLNGAEPTPKPKVESKPLPDDPDTEVLMLPRSTKIIRVTAVGKCNSGEMAHLSEIRAKPEHYPHIKILDEKNDRGCTIVTRKKIEPKTFEDLKKGKATSTRGNAPKAKQPSKASRVKTKAKKAQASAEVKLTKAFDCFDQ
jgi:hypothetical protein